MLSRIKDANDPATVPWQMNTLDATGRVLDETLGAGVRVVTGFDSPGGRLSSRQSGVGGGNAIQNLSYEWDLNDNLTARRDYQQTPSVHETFTYDTLDRLDTSMRNGTTNLDVNYDASGNVTSKSDVGSYTYDATKIHAVTTAGSNTYSYDANGNVISRNGSTLGWTSYDRPSRIDNGTGTVSYLWYDAERRLWRQEAHTSGVPETTVYVGELLEKVTKDGLTSWKHYVEAPTGTAAVYLRRSDGTASTYYLTHDHLGSTDKVLDATGGIVTVAESFTALGARRGANWQGTPTPAELAAIASTTRDGFTGHVMLDNVGLVHMQGRVYDPSIGRFLSADPIVRDVAAAQSWNGYGYVEGRVTSWTDPSGWAAVSLKKRTQHRADPPRSAWVTSIGGYWRDFSVASSYGGVTEDGIPIAITGSSRSSVWISTGVDRGMLRQIDAGQGATGERSQRESGEAGPTRHAPCPTKVDAADLARDFAACDGDWSCENRVIAAARDVGLVRLPDPMQFAQDFVSLVTWPVRVLTPGGRAADFLVNLSRGTYNFISGDNEWIGISGGMAFDLMYRRVLTPLNREFGERAGTIVGDLMESVVQGGYEFPGQDEAACGD